MIIESIILLAIAAAKITAVVYIAFLVFGEIIDWFESHRKIGVAESDQICFTLQEQLTKGNYKTVQGVLNKSTNSLDNVRKICECRCGAPGWRTTRLGAGDPA